MEPLRPQPELWPVAQPLAQLPIPPPANVQYPGENYGPDLHFIANYGLVLAAPPRPAQPLWIRDVQPPAAVNPPAPNPQPPARPRPIPLQNRLRMYELGYANLWNPYHGNYGAANVDELPTRRRVPPPPDDDPPVKTECPVCFERYNQTSHPKLGSCGHSICLACELRIQNHRCPFCNAEGAFKYSQRNFLAEHLIAEQFEAKKEYDDELKKKEAELENEKSKFAAASLRLEQMGQDMKRLAGDKIEEPEAGPSRTLKRNLEESRPIVRERLKFMKIEFGDGGETVEKKTEEENGNENEEEEEEDGDHAEDGEEENEEENEDEEEDEEDEEEEEAIAYTVETDASNNTVIVIDDSD